MPTLQRLYCRKLAMAGAFAILATCANLPVSSAALAGEADVTAAKVRKTATGVFNFDVTIRSNDKGWNYYCDRFEVLAMDGQVLGSRTLFHPHETEQPFTRDLYNVKIPTSVTKVRIRARHKPKGYNGKILEVTLPK